MQMRCQDKNPLCRKPCPSLDTKIPHFRRVNHNRTSQCKYLGFPIHEQGNTLQGKHYGPTIP